MARKNNRNNVGKSVGKKARKGSRTPVRNTSVAAAVSVSLFSFAPLAQAAPSGGSVMAGTATIDTSQALKTLITQTSNKAVIDWNDFSINANELVKFIQNSSSSVALNRVTGANVSQIMGTLQANGNIFLINPNGIVFGATAQVDVAGLLASTFDITNTDFMNGNYNFTGSLKTGSISNAGTLEVGDNGFIYLIAPNVDNSGHIIANVGSVTLGNDGTYSFDLTGNGLVTFTFSSSDASDTGVTTSLKNSGQIDGNATATPGGHTQQVLLSGSQTQGVVSSVVNSGDIKAATGLTLSGSTVDNSAGTVELDVQSGDPHDRIALNSGDPATTGSVDFQNTSLSSSGTVNGTVKVSNATGGVTLNNADVNGDLSVSAAGQISGAGNTGGDATADHLSLTTTAQGADIGGQGNPLNIDANTLSASADQGNIVITDVAGDLALDGITTNDTSSNLGLRVIIEAQNGSLTGVSSVNPNVEAWATNLKADGSIGSASQAVTTDVKVLSASTQDGGINLDNSGGPLLVNTVSAGQRITQNGQTVSSTAVSNANGDVTLSNGAAGSHDVTLRSDQDIILTNGVTATGNLTLDSQNGAIYKSGSSALLTGSTINLDAAGGIGQTGGGALGTQSNQVNAQSGGDGIYLSEGAGLNVGSVIASGTNNDVSLAATQGDINLQGVQAAGGNVTVKAAAGSITGSGAGTSPNLTAGGATLNASGAIGSGSQYLFTRVDNLTTASTGNLAGTYVSNQGPLATANITTVGGPVSVQNSAGGTLAFNGGTGELGETGGPVQTGGLTFDNTGGGLLVDGMDLSGQAVSLTASEGITGNGGTLAADTLNLSAQKGIDLTTKVSGLDASSTHNDITIDNSAQSGALAASARAGAGNVTLTQGGDLRVKGIQASGDVSLTAGGAITGSGNGNDISAANLSLTGNGIGAAGAAMNTRVGGTLTADAGTGGLFLANVGSLSLLNGEAGGDINLSVSGDAILGTLNAGGDVTFSATGRITDGNGGTNNITANKATLSAQGIGASGAMLDMKVDQLVLDVSNGSLYVRNLNGQPLNLTHAKAAGGDIGISTAGDLNLGSVSASGHNVTLTSGGAINDARTDTSVANVQAKNLDMQAQNGIGNTGPLALDVDAMSLSGGSGNVNAANMGPVAVDSTSLQGKGAAGVTIVATTITILDDNGNVITVNGGNLTLTATDGNIVFLNQNDTIQLTGGGNITLTAKADPNHPGFNGNIVTGNLTTDGGGISLNADGNITLGMLDTGGLGDISVTANHGVILDGNGSAANINGKNVTLVANTPTTAEAAVTQQTAIADYAAKLALLASDKQQLQNLQQQLDAYIAMLNSAKVQLGIAQSNQSSLQSQYDSLSAQVAAAQAVDDALNTALNVATVVRNAVAIGAGAAQAIPFSGDAGADAAFAVVDLALSVAQTALDSYERYSLAPLTNDLGNAQTSLTQAMAVTQDATTSVNTLTSTRDAWQASVADTTQAVFNAQVASDASEVLRKQAIDAAAQNSDIGTSAANPLGVEAQRLDITTTGGTPLDNAVYLTSGGNLTLGNIDSSGLISVKGVSGNIGVAGNVVSPSLITLQASGAVQGLNGTLSAPDIALDAQTGIGAGSVLNTGADVIAATSKTGNINIDNSTAGGDPLLVGTVDGVSGVLTDGNVSLTSNGELDLQTQVGDTNTSTDNSVDLTAGGAIVDDNGSALNVTGHDLSFTAVNGVEMDTAADNLIDGEVTGGGNVTLRNQGGLNIENLNTASGNLDVTAGGDMILGALSTDPAGDINLAATGRIDDDQNNATLVKSHSLELTAGGGIGATGDNTHRALDTRVDTVSADAKGETNIDNGGDLSVTHLATTQGDVTLLSDTGALHLGQVSSAGNGATITAQAAGTIDALDPGATTPQLQADQLALRAGNGIGTPGSGGVNGLPASPLLVQTSALEADGGAGSVYIDNINTDLTIGGVTPNLGLPALSGVQGTGDVQVRAADGALTVNEGVTQTGTGSLELSSASDLTDNATLEAAGDLKAGSVNGGLIVNGQSVTAGGNAQLSAGQDLTLTSGSNLQAGGSLDTQAGAGISLDNAQADSSGGNGTFTANGGDIDLAHGAGIDTAGTLGMTASQSIGLSDGSSAHSGGDLTANATAGDLNIIDSQLTSDAALSAEAGGAVTVTNSLVSSGPASSTSSGDLSLTADNGDLTVNNDTGGAGSTVNAGGDLDLTAKVANVAVHDGSRLTAGNALTGSAGGNVTLDSGATLTATGGDMTLTATQGNLVADAATLKTGGAFAGTAGQGVTVTAGASITATNDVALDAQGADLTLTSGADVAAGGNLTGDAGQGVTVANGSQVSADGTLSLDAKGKDLALNYGGYVHSGGDLSLTALNALSLSNRSHVLSTGGKVDLTATNAGITVDDSAVEAGGGLTANAGTDILLTNTSTASVGGSLKADNGDMDLQAGDNITLNRASSASASGNLTGHANSGDLSVSQSSSMTATAGKLDLHAGGNAGVSYSTLTAGTDLDITADQGNLTVTDGSTAIAGGNIGLTATAGDVAVHNSSQLTAADALTGTAGGNVTLDSGATLTATTGDMTLTATQGNLVADAATLKTGGAFAGTAGQGVTATDGSTLTAAGQASLDAQGADLLMDNSSALTAGAGLSLSAQGNLTLDHRANAYANGGDATLAASTGNLDLNNGDIVQASGNLTGTAGQGIALTNGSDLLAGGTLTLNAEGKDLSLDNSSKAQSVGDLSLTALDAMSLSNDSQASSTGGTVDLTATNGDMTLTTGALVEADSDLTATSGGTLSLSQAAMQADTGNAKLTAADSVSLDQGSSVTAAGDLSADAQAGDLTANAGSTLTATGGKLDLHAANGIAFTQASQASAGTGLTANAGTDILLTNTSTASGSVGGSLTADTGDMTLEAGDNITLNQASRADATAAALSMTADNGNVALSQGSETSAGTTLGLTASDTVSLADSNATSGGDMTLTGSAGDVTVSNGEISTGGILDAHAGNGITLTNALAISGAHDPSSPAPAQQDAGMTLTADHGDITLTASQARSGGDLTGKAGQNIGLTDADATAAGAATLTAGTDATNGAGADITLANSHVTANGADATLTAANGISLAQASTVVAHDSLSAAAQAGDLSLAGNSTLAAQTGKMELDAGNRVSFTDSSATAATSMNVDASAAGIALNNSHATAGTGATLTAGTDITLTHSADPNTTGSTVLAQSGDLSLDAGGNIALDSASSGVAQGNLTATAETGDLTVIEQSKLLAQSGKMDLQAGNRVGVTDSALNAATDLTVNAAAADIALDNSQATAGDNLTMTAGTDVTLVNGSHADANNGGLAITGTAGNVMLTDSVANAHGTLDLSAGDNVGLTRSNATAGGDMSLIGTGGDVTLGQSHVTTAGNLTGKAGLNLGLTDSTATATGAVGLTAGQGVAVTDSTLVAATDLSADATGADIAFTNSHATAQSGDATLTAADGISLAQASTVTAHGNLSADAQAGDLSLAGHSTLTAQTGKMALDAGNGVAFTDSAATAATSMNVDASAAGITLENSHATAGTDLSLTAGTDIGLTHSADPNSTGSSLSAQTGNLSLDAGGNIALDSASSGAAAGDLTATAETGDLTVIQQSSLTAQTGNMDLGAGNGVAVTDSVLSAATDLNVDATAADIAVTNSTATAGGTLSAHAANNMALSNADLESGDSGASSMTLTADHGDITAANSLTRSQGGLTASAGGAFAQSGTSQAAAVNGDLSIDAGNGITLTDASASGNLVGQGGQGGVDMLSGSQATAGGDLSLSGDGDLDLTQLQAGGDVTLTSNKGGINADANVAENVTGNNLVISAAKGVGSALSSLKTKVATLYATLTGQGDLYLDEADALTVKQAQLANGDAHITTGGDLTVDTLSANGNAVLNSGGALTTATGGLISAGDLNATAVTGIDVDSALNSATLAVTGNGNIDLANQGALSLNGAATANGTIGVDAGGDLGIGQVSAPVGNAVTLTSGGAIRADGAGNIDASDVTLTAATGIGDQGGALHLDAATLSATSGNGDINLDQTGTVALDKVATGNGAIDVAVQGGDATLGDIHANGDVTLTAADGALFDDGNTATGVSGDTVTLASANGIGDAPITTRANRLDASVSGKGDIYVQEADGLAGLNASAANGNINVSTITGDLTVDQVKALSPGNAVMLSAAKGMILDGDAAATNIVASLLQLAAGHGIGRASNPLDVRVDSLGANGGDGGVYINNGGSGPLDLLAMTGKGPLALNTGGDLSIDSNVNGGSVSFNAGGNVDQHADIFGTNGVHVGGGGNVTMDPGTSTGSLGTINYSAGKTLTVSSLATTTGLTGGRIELQGRTVLSNAGYWGSWQGGSVMVRSVAPVTLDFPQLLGYVNGKARVGLNDRTLGGKLTESSPYMHELNSPQEVLSPAVTVQLIPLADLTFRKDVIGDGWSFNP